MAEDLGQNLAQWKEELERAWRGIPKLFRSERSIHRTLQCRLYRIIQKMGYQAVADYMPPRVADRPVDIIAVKGDMDIVYALCIDPVVTLAAVKSLGSFEAGAKIIITTSHLEKKVQESRFFLNPDITHIHLKPFDKMG